MSLGAPADQGAFFAEVERAFVEGMETIAAKVSLDDIDKPRTLREQDAVESQAVVPPSLRARASSKIFAGWVTTRCPRECSWRVMVPPTEEGAQRGERHIKEHLERGCRAPAVTAVPMRSLEEVVGKGDTIIGVSPARAEPEPVCVLCMQAGHWTTDCPQGVGARERHQALALAAGAYQSYENYGSFRRQAEEAELEELGDGSEEC